METDISISCGCPTINHQPSTLNPLRPLTTDWESFSCHPFFCQRQRQVFRVWRIRRPRRGRNEGPLRAVNPDQVPDAVMRDLAKTMLKVKGVGRAALGATRAPA